MFLEVKEMLDDIPIEDTESWIIRSDGDDVELVSTVPVSQDEYKDMAEDVIELLNATTMGAYELTYIGSKGFRVTNKGRS